MLTVVTGAGCAWTAASTADWVTLSPASGSGPGNVRFWVETVTGLHRGPAHCRSDRDRQSGIGLLIFFALGTHWMSVRLASRAVCK